MEKETKPSTSTTKENPTQPKPPQEASTSKSDEKPAPDSKGRRESLAQRLGTTFPDMLSPRRLSRKSGEFDSLPTAPNKSVLKRPGEESPHGASPPGDDDNYQVPEGGRKSTVYNPFTSFEKRVSISDTSGIPSSKPSERPKSASFATEEGNLRRMLGPITEESQSHSRLQTIPKPLAQAPRRRSIPAAELTRQDISVCFFPEEPDWDDDDDFSFGRDYSSRRKSSLGIKDDSDKSYMDERERWSSRMVYLISLISYSISFSNVYHFPTLVYHFGGLAFIIPYTFFTIVLGYPLHFLVSSLGQYSQSGPVRVWNCAPIGRGIGWSMFLLCVFVAYYQNMYAAYSVVYFARCFKALLPWQDCDDPSSSTSNFSCVPRMCARSGSFQYTPAEHYFFDHILQVQYSKEILSNGLGPMIWTQVLGFFLSWVLVYFAIINSVRSIGKVSFCLIVFPYFVLLMLLTAGFLLEGSSNGLFMLFRSDFAKMLDLQLWRAAAEQVFFELGLAQGTPLAYASYCHHRNPTHIDSAIICTINYLTSMLCALVVFNVLGALSMEMTAPLFDVIHQGPALVYIVYPEALSRVPGSHFWCAAFFLMLFSVCISTQIALMETALCVIYDEFNDARRYRWLLNLTLCCGLFCTGVILCTSNGFYVVHLLNSMVGRMPRLPIAVCLVGVIVFIYGMRKYCEDMHFMLDHYPFLGVRICWFLTPFILGALIIPSWILDKPLTVRGSSYIKDAIMVAWFIMLFVLIWIILGAIYWICVCKYMGYPMHYIWKSLTSWGPRSFEERIARTEFSSEHVSNFSQPWIKKNIPLNI